jgi:hypothetical protein
MKIEFILDAGKLLYMSLLITLNCFLEEGFPKALSTNMVHALFKRGNASKFDNYRGIIVVPVATPL